MNYYECQYLVEDPVTLETKNKIGYLYLDDISNGVSLINILLNFKELIYIKKINSINPTNGFDIPIADGDVVNFIKHLNLIKKDYRKIYVSNNGIYFSINDISEYVNLKNITTNALLYTQDI